MALRNCEECGHQVSDKAFVCPSCGRRLYLGAGNTLLVTVLVTALVFAALFIIVKVVPRGPETWPHKDPQWNRPPAGMQGTIISIYRRNGKVVVYKNGWRVFEGTQEEFNRRGGKEGFR